MGKRSVEEGNADAADLQGHSNKRVDIPGKSETTLSDDNDGMGDFEDPYGDEFESEDEDMINELDDEDDEEDGEIIEEETIAEEGGRLESIKEDEISSESIKQDQEKTNKRGLYMPHLAKPLGPDEMLEPDPSAYIMLHHINMAWPCLSLDIIHDNLGQERRRFPQTIYFAVGTQAQKKKDNEISVIKASSLCRTYEHDSDDEDEQNDDDDDDDDEQTDPILESKALPTPYPTNRIRLDRQPESQLAASMSECGDVYIWNIKPHLTWFETPGTQISKQQNRPQYTITSHGRVEGYAVDWARNSPTSCVATGDISGRIYITTQGQSSWHTDKVPFLGHESSVEELQWSPSERNVLASCGADGTIKIWDTRQQQSNHKPAVSVKASDSDVNVMSWNPKVTNLLAAGYDDGQWGIWDLRSFKSSSEKSSKPSTVASFDFHKSPITSIEFHPTDESTLAVSSEDNTVTLWDLSVEADDEEIAKQKREAGGDLQNIPPQLMFVHWQRNVKEAHWHSQIPGTIVSTGSDGVDIWKTISI